MQSTGCTASLDGDLQCLELAQLHKRTIPSMQLLYKQGRTVHKAIVDPEAHKVLPMLHVLAVLWGGCSLALGQLILVMREQQVPGHTASIEMLSIIWQPIMLRASSLLGLRCTSLFMPSPESTRLPWALNPAPWLMQCLEDTAFIYTPACQAPWRIITAVQEHLGRLTLMLSHPA